MIKKMIKTILPHGIVTYINKQKMKDSVMQLKVVEEKRRIYSRNIFKETFLKQTQEGEYIFNFNGALLPNICNDSEKLDCLIEVFSDTFMFSCLFDDNYDKSKVNIFDLYMNEGPYGYQDDDFDVTVKQGDIVIDAGAWIGDFSAYAANKGTVVYAFEPIEENFCYLEETAKLNQPHKVYPVNKGLGNCEGSVPIYLAKSSVANTILKHRNIPYKTVKVTTLDKYVEENNIHKIDFIKADIEGSERDMLMGGGGGVLKTFAPKLAICTYHLPDDQEVLERIILDANQKYKIVHLRKKLFASVM